MAIIELEGLRKRYLRVFGRSVVAVDGLDLSVPEGGVFAFLGPDGAGKTTTIRCLLGLARPTGGTCSVLGVETRPGLPDVIARVGALVDPPQFTPKLSARRNLQLLGALRGIAKNDVVAVLERVGLAEWAKEPVRDFLPGMKQRLGLAAALLKDPEVLVLDEPASGLDPAGIVGVRELLRGLADEGRTVFVASHMLSEVQNIADHVAIINRGRLVKSGPIDEVLATSAVRGVVVRLEDPDEGIVALRDAGMTVERREDGSLYVDPPGEGATAIAQILAARGLFPAELRQDRPDLETVFLELTREPAEGAW